MDDQVVTLVDEKHMEAVLRGELNNTYQPYLLVYEDEKASLPKEA